MVGWIGRVCLDDVVDDHKKPYTQTGLNSAKLCLNFVMLNVMFKLAFPTGRNQKWERHHQNRPEPWSLGASDWLKGPKDPESIGPKKGPWKQFLKYLEKYDYQLYSIIYIYSIIDQFMALSKPVISLSMLVDKQPSDFLKNALTMMVTSRFPRNIQPCPAMWDGG